MNYELAKKLKDAGFDQQEQLVESELGGTNFTPISGGYHLTYDGVNPEIDKPRYTKYFSLEYLNSEEGKNLTVYIPTLSELIEACGDGFQFLSVDNFVGKNILTGSRGEIIGWKAGNKALTLIDEEEGIVTKGLTPEESVAKLWLALNKKK